ncbi:MAG: DUF4917 family protein [Cyclobacteriaceae bacterium]|nr:DUF4917 family protein [Cyclobacteriaceae bacterium]
MRTIGDIKIYHWSEIQDSFLGADIFLGNGFSININTALNYRSLFDRFLTYLDAADQLIFKKFNMTNFEGIQGKLVDGSEVNKAFDLDTLKFESALKKLRLGLLGAIKDLHPAYSQIDPNTIFQLSQKLDWFEDIYTTNYDTFLYHIMLATLDRAKRNSVVKKYQDFFRAENGRLEFADKLLTGFKNIYYLHGALFLRKEDDRIIKIRRGARNEELLELIRLQVHIGYLPIFVSEGRAALKAETISKNQYLSFCRDAFKASSNGLVIYGFSFSKCDDHLITHLNGTKRKLAIGIYLKGLTETQIQRHIRGIHENLFKYRAREIKFFESSSLF